MGTRLCAVSSKRALDLNPSLPASPERKLFIGKQFESTAYDARKHGGEPPGGFRRLACSCGRDQGRVNSSTQFAAVMPCGAIAKVTSRGSTRVNEEYGQRQTVPFVRSG